VRIKVAALGNPDSANWYQWLSNSLKDQGIDFVFLTGVPEVINLLRQEKFDLALVDSGLSDAENICFRISWLGRTQVAVVAEDLDRDWGPFSAVGVDSVLSTRSGSREIIKLIESLAKKGRPHFPAVRVLLVEDDRFVRDAVEVCFRVYWPESEIFMTESGRSVMDYIKYKNINMVLLDLGLPDVPGFEVLKEIRAYCQVPVIILTANRFEEMVKKSIQNGANDYIVKPFKQMELLPRILKVISQDPTIPLRPS
jgi:DNA-binding response OmpR family regulator